MLFQIKHNGQLCNRLFSLIPTMAYAIHNNVKLYVLLQDRKYLDYFPNIYNNRWVRFLFSKDDNDHSKLYRMTKWISNNPKKNIDMWFDMNYERQFASLTWNTTEL